MKCPRCGMEMEQGRVVAKRGDETLFWAPYSFFNKHILWYKFLHRDSVIEKEGGIVITSNSTRRMNSASYGCKKCRMLVLDCK